MRRYADPVEVRRGPVTAVAAEPGVDSEGPQQFLWHGRLWKVRAVLAHWVETGAWWQAAGARAAVGADGPAEATAGARVPLGDLVTEREFWRVEAGRGRPQPVVPDDDAPPVAGVFDLSFDWADGRWTLVGCTD